MSDIQRRRKGNRFSLLLIPLFIIQLYVPVHMVVQRERTLSQGDVVKFQVEPVDPYDAFRGRYLRIGLTDDSAPSGGEVFFEDQRVYVLLEKDSGGFAVFAEVSSRPFKDRLYMKGTIDSVKGDTLHIIPPFSRYYLNEDFSLIGEELYNRYSRGKREDAYVTVRIRKGRAVLEDMYLAGREINSLIEEELNLRSN